MATKMGVILLVICSSMVLGDRPCECSCCVGNDCSPYYIGSTPVSNDCAECSVAKCKSAFGGVCPDLVKTPGAIRTNCISITIILVIVPIISIIVVGVVMVLVLKFLIAKAFLSATGSFASFVGPRVFSFLGGTPDHVPLLNRDIPVQNDTTPPVPLPTTLHEAEARSLLKENHIKVNKEPPQTKLEGVRRDTLEEVISVANILNPLGHDESVITITGGTESHTAGQHSHAKGYKLDIRSNEKLDDYVTHNFTPDGERAGPHGGARYISKSGAEWVMESDHWDVSVVPKKKN